MDGVVGGNVLVARMQRAAQLDVALYNEVEHDPAATPQAFHVVLIAGVASGLGTFLSLLLRGHGVAGLAGLVSEVVSLVVNWFVWSYVTYFIGTRLFNGRATPQELLRTLGFAITPLVLNVLGFIPVLGGLARFVAFWWMVIAGVIAVREALDVGTGAAILTVIIGAVCMLVIWGVMVVVLAALSLPLRLL
ncbi:MAG TPA: hypothetical protein VKZ60_19630 [Chloroflexota bacterium]|nr:hypothetical protein [Chloroflexota bacterium]